jgi:hypothetical protein
MRKSILLFSLLIASTSFALSECETTIDIGSQPVDAGNKCPAYWDNIPYGSDPDYFSSQTYFKSGDACSVITISCYYVDECFDGNTPNASNVCVPPSCPSGETMGTHGCSPTIPPPPDPNHPLGEFDGDQDGCNGAGGYYMANTKCNTLGEAVKDIYSSPTAVVGAFLTIGGAIIGSAGMASTPITGPFGGGVAGVGAWATGVGLGMMGISGANKMFNATPNTTSTDVTNGTQRIKLSLKDVSGGSASVVTNTSTTTKKVDSATYIPPSVKAEMAKPEYVNKTTGDLAKPLPMAGVQTTTYNYSTNKATTTTHEAGSTSTTPITTTRTTNITVTQNSDGTVTTVPADTTIAPIVSGSGGGSVSSSASTTWGTGTGGTGTGTGTGTGSGDKDYTAVLNDIKKNTGDSAGFLGDILGMFENDTQVDSNLSDGTENFNDYEKALKDSVKGFVITDPLGLNDISSGSSIPSYGFTILGTHFVIMDQALLNQLPLDLLRGLFLFMSALAGLITVFSGV